MVIHNDTTGADDFVIRRHPKSHTILMIGMTPDGANRFNKAAGAPYVWWSAQDQTWEISEPSIENAIRHATKRGMIVHDLRDEPIEAHGYASRPPWCGECDERTRTTDSRFGVIRCPRCHPNPAAPTSTIPKEEIDVYHEGIAIVRAELAAIKKRLHDKHPEQYEPEDPWPF